MIYCIYNFKTWAEWGEALWQKVANMVIGKLKKNCMNLSSQGADNHNSSFFATIHEENCEKEKDKQVLCV